MQGGALFYIASDYSTNTGLVLHFSGNGVNHALADQLVMNPVINDYLEGRQFPK
jgi:hypothetical protein